MFSKYIVYVDESGDHGLNRVDMAYPVFVLVFCIFRKRDYAEGLMPALQKFKFDYFGHDQVILHERDIRKRQGDFSFLKDRALRSMFMDDMSHLIAGTTMTLVVTLIDKQALIQRYSRPNNPYDLSMQFALERLERFWAQQGQSGLTHVVVERRGKVEDAQLKETFERVCAGDNWNRRKMPFRLVFADKKSNSAGLQLADLIARPAGLAYLRPNQCNRAWEIVREKLYGRTLDQKMDGYGFKVFP